MFLRGLLTERGEEGEPRKGCANSGNGWERDFPLTAQGVSPVYSTTGAVRGAVILCLRPWRSSSQQAFSQSVRLTSCVIGSSWQVDQGWREGREPAAPASRIWDVRSCVLERLAWTHLGRGLGRASDSGSPGLSFCRRIAEGCEVLLSGALTGWAGSGL